LGLSAIEDMIVGSDRQSWPLLTAVWIAMV